MLYCTIADCARRHKGRGYCNLHLKRLRKHGDTETIGQSGRPPKGELPTWDALHHRLARARGKAADHLCVDCGKNAREWSYNGSDSEQLVGSDHGFFMAYSLNLLNYEPRCTSCHRLFDNALRSKPGATIRYAPDEAPRFIVTITDLGIAP